MISQNGGTPIAGGFLYVFETGKSKSKMDDHWGYPYFIKTPPFNEISRIPKMGEPIYRSIAGWFAMVCIGTSDL